MSYKGPRAKKSRALGVALTPKAAIIMEKRPNGPGMHGARRRGSKSDFGLQLIEKQKLKFQYNVSERQLRMYFSRAKSMKGSTGERLLQLLESRLDNVVLRAGFAPTIYAARQLVSHGHVEVNGRRVNIASQLVSQSDVISIRNKSKQLLCIQEALGRTTRPNYVETDQANLTAKIARIPEGHEVPVVCNVQAVVEFYSK